MRNPPWRTPSYSLARLRDRGGVRVRTALFVGLLPLFLGAAATPTLAPIPQQPAKLPPSLVEQRSPFERISMTEAVQRALQKSPAALLAQQDVALAAAQVTQVRSQALPTLTAGGTYTRIDDDRRIGDQVFVPANQLVGTVTLALPLLAPQRWAAWAQARDDQKAVQLQAVETRRQIALRVAYAYLAVLADQRTVEVSERAVVIAEEHYAYSRKRLSGGVGSQLDEVRAQQLLREESGRLLRSHADLLRAQGNLGSLLGENHPVDAGDPPELPQVASVRAEGHGETTSASTLDELHRQMQTLRPDIIAEVARLRAAEHAVNLRYVDYLPSLTAAFTPMYQDPASIVQPQLSWQAQIQLTVPLYDGGLRYGVLHERRARRTIAELRLQDTVQQGRVELTVGLGVLGHGERALDEARQAVTLARRAVDIAALSYRMGAATNLELLDAQRRAHDAETAAIVAEDEVRRARLELLATTGRFP